MIVVYLWGFVICLAGVVFVALRFGYQGIESQIFTWLLNELDSGLTGASYDGLVKRTEVFEKLSNVQKVLYTINMWPFDVKVFVDAILVYFAQVFFALRKIVGKVVEVRSKVN